MAESGLERQLRIPLYLKVVARPGLQDCWSFNLSVHGMALVGTPQVPGELPKLGSQIQVDFALPGEVNRIRARGTVRWVDDQLGPGRQVAFGILFTKVDATAVASLARYVAAYRPNLAVFAPSLEDLNLCQATLGEDVYLHPAWSPNDLHKLLNRGDIAAVLIYGASEETALEAVSVIGLGSTTPRPGVPVLADRTRVILCGALDPLTLLGLHNEGRIYQSLRPPYQADALKAAVSRALEDYAVRLELQRVSRDLDRSLLREQSGSESPQQKLEQAPIKQLIFESPAMRDVLTLIALAAPYKANVLLQGETGAGKEVLARAVHDLSDRSNAPFVALDCGALTETLLESELFGHVRGAFTGAEEDHPGLFRIADGGTIFLDEIENMSPNLQIKLLRVLETSQVRPVGSAKVREVDIRLVAASNHDLAAEVAAGRFRADLYYRLNIFPIEVPALRNRREDIIPLARYFLAQICHAVRRPLAELERTVEPLLVAHQWPGNVRELRNAIERAVLLCPPDREISPALLPATIGKTREMVIPAGASLRGRIDAVEREAIRDALQRAGGVLGQAATELGMNAVTLGRRARRHGLWPWPQPA
jgi:DNA-binding NtrC family response regulator